jgi:hypothetical protein
MHKVQIAVFVHCNSILWPQSYDATAANLVSTRGYMLYIPLSVTHLTA